MAQQLQPQYEFHYQRVELLKTEELGIGSYGAVCKAMCDDLPCAAKILHRTLFQSTAPGNTSVMRKFEQECHLLNAIKHPHIVQYLGTYHDPESRLPVLLMELMDESLTRFLQRSHEPIPYYTEVNLCHDIAMALSYLHSNGIIHRDLSSNNVLLIAGRRAKVTDFGMVKLYDVNRSTAHFTPLTLCPGTTVYMSPEALREQPVYTDKLDSFSLGVLCVQIMTRQFPDPSNRVTIVEDSQYPTGTIEVPVPEIERRQSHIDLIDLAHPLLPVALDCLKDRDRERPSCHELCGHISTLKASLKYTESVQQSQVNTKPTQSAERESREREIQQSQQIQDLQQQLHILRDQLQEKEQENQQQQQQILGLRTLLTAKDEQLAGKDHQLQQKEVTHQQEIQQLRQQLQSSEQVAQRNVLEREMIQDLQRQVRELQQQLRQRGSPRQEEGEASGVAASGDSIKLRWRDGGRAPCKMYGDVSVVDGSVAYFRPRRFIERNNEVFTYTFATNKWSELPECTNSDVSLAMVNSLLTAIGGKTSNREVTNSLLSLTENKWTKRFPPMPTKRWLTAVVCSGKSLIVAGGEGEGKKYLSTVEVMDTETLQWSTASSLPHPLGQSTVTLIADRVYMLGGWDHNDKQSKSVFTCSLAALLLSCQPQSLGARLMNLSLARRHQVWHQVANTPVTFSTCASLHGQLLAVGGCDSDDKETTAIHMYNTTTNSWEVISHMTTPRYQCLVAVFAHNELMVVGGLRPDSLTGTNSAEVASII